MHEVACGEPQQGEARALDSFLISHLAAGEDLVTLREEEEMGKVSLSLFSFCYFNIKNPSVQEMKKTSTISMNPSSVRQWSVTARCCGGLMV